MAPAPSVKYGEMRLSGYIKWTTFTVASVLSENCPIDCEIHTSPERFGVKLCAA